MMPSARTVQELGVIVMELLSDDSASVSNDGGGCGGTHDPLFRRLVVVFNARPGDCTVPWPEGARRRLSARYCPVRSSVALGCRVVVSSRVMTNLHGSAPTQLHCEKTWAAV